MAACDLILGPGVQAGVTMPSRNEAYRVAVSMGRLGVPAPSPAGLAMRVHVNCLAGRPMPTED